MCVYVLSKTFNQFRNEKKIMIGILPVSSDGVSVTDLTLSEIRLFDNFGMIRCKMQISTTDDLIKLVFWLIFLANLMMNFLLLSSHQLEKQRGKLDYGAYNYVKVNQQ